MQLINYRLRAHLTDGRSLTGQMLAYDKHMNLILSDCEEFRMLRKKKAKGKRCVALAITCQCMHRPALFVLTASTARLMTRPSK